jgi:hypothetical protein
MRRATPSRVRDAGLPAESRLSAGRALLYGTLTVGVLDILDAFVFFGFRGVGPVVILQSIASGLLGRAAYDGGLATAVLGVLLHFFIAFSIVAIYIAVSREINILRRRPLLFGPLYGVAAYLVMTLIVVPLSAAVTGPRTFPVVVNGVLIHALGVGLPSALFARAARAPGDGLDPAAVRR